MYSTCALAPPFLAAKLVAGNNFAPGAKFLLVTTEGGSVSLRTSDEGGSNFGHQQVSFRPRVARHRCLRPPAQLTSGAFPSPRSGSKAAQNMVGRLLSLDLAPKGVTVVNIHVGSSNTDRWLHGLQQPRSLASATPPTRADPERPAPLCRPLRSPAS